MVIPFFVQYKEAMKYIMNFIYMLFPSLLFRKVVKKQGCKCKNCGCDPETGRYKKPLLKG